MNLSIAGNLKRIINERGYKQNVIAQKAGFEPAKFNNMLNGRKIITDMDILPICNVLGITPNDLFGLSTTQEPSERG